jgi:hypothetical protein
MSPSRRSSFTFVAVGMALQLVAACGSPPPENSMGDPIRLEVPLSMQEEHEAIHTALEAAAALTGPVGQAARDLVVVLHPHFVREEQIALPPLALLEPLARGEYEPWMRDVLPMTDSLRAELPQMLREHEAIGSAARRLEEVAREEGVPEVERLARELQRHARSEEELFYPAAVLVGDLVRMHAR